MKTIDISEMLHSLLKKGLKQKDIRDRTGVNAATISRSLKGKHIPNYKNGKAIETLYNEVMNKGE